MTEAVSFWDTPEMRAITERRNVQWAEYMIFGTGPISAWAAQSDVDELKRLARLGLHNRKELS